MYKIPINYSGINNQEKEIDFIVKGVNYVLTLRKPRREDCYFIDISDYNGKKIVSNLHCSLGVSLFSFVSYDPFFKGFFIFLPNSLSFKDKDLVYPMLGNGYNLFYVDYKEAGLL